jgi:hypothetical protein
MRSVLALGLFVTLYASADAATVHHSKPRYVIVRPSQDMTPVYGSQDMIPVYGSPEWARLHREDTPSYDDPSKFGGG